MKCPVCPDVKMREVEKDGVLIDICPECKGVWLDRGELDKLLQGVREVKGQYDEWYERYEYDRDRRYDPSYDKAYKDYHRYPKKKKRTVFDLFDDLFD